MWESRIILSFDQPASWLWSVMFHCWQVHTYYKRCNSRAMCNCAVSVRVGDDVILVDKCGGKNNLIIQGEILIAFIQSKFWLEFPKKLSKLLRYHWGSVSVNSKVMHCLLQYFFSKMNSVGVKFYVIIHILIIIPQLLGDRQ